MERNMTEEITWFTDEFEPDKDGKVSDDPKQYSSLWDEDDWEDGDFESSINAKYPGWFLVKMPGFTQKTFDQVDPWLVENTGHLYSKVGWDSGCSTSVGVVFQSTRDAMLFKLRWR
jgi:hypothetical protein